MIATYADVAALASLLTPPNLKKHQANAAFTSVQITYAKFGATNPNNPKSVDQLNLITPSADSTYAATPMKLKNISNTSDGSTALLLPPI
jgi:hypothetical protein